MEPRGILFSNSCLTPWTNSATIHVPDVVRDLRVVPRVDGRAKDKLYVITDYAMYRVVHGKRFRLKKVKEG